MNSPLNTTALRRTPLHALHLELGARMVPFAKYEMPLQYRDGIVREHLHTRSAAGLFDVSHMGQIRLTGNLQALERLCPIDIGSLLPGQQRYSVMTGERGGIIDDLMIARTGDHLLLTVNAACKQDDIAHLRRHLLTDCYIEELSDRALLALQGPAAAAVLARRAPATTDLPFMNGAWFALAGMECFVTRSGYTGEDGFEISVRAEQAQALARALLAESEVAPIGLGARDSLRLEAGMCLHGQDIDTTTTPVEAGLAWVIARSRRAWPPQDSFAGAEVILAQLRDGVARQRVGLLPEGNIPVRAGAMLTNAEGTPVGTVTSGGFSPTLNRPISMAYVSTVHSAHGTLLQATVRNKPVPVKITPLPFVPPRYRR